MMKWWRCGRGRIAITVSVVCSLHLCKLSMKSKLWLLVHRKGLVLLSRFAHRIQARVKRAVDHISSRSSALPNLEAIATERRLSIRYRNAPVAAF